MYHNEIKDHNGNKGIYEPFLCHSFYIMLVDMAALHYVIHACVVIYYDVCFNEIAMLCLTF